MNKTKKNYIQIIILLALLFLLSSCKITMRCEGGPIPWGTLINRDGTDLEFLFRYIEEARFTEDSNSIIYSTRESLHSEEGIYKRNLDGTEEKISDSYTPVNKISRDLNYILKVEEDIFITDIEGYNEINLTNNTELEYIDPAFSLNSKWLTYVSINSDTLSTINLLNLETFELTKIFENSHETFYQPIYDTIGNIYFFKVENVSLFLKKYSINEQTFYKLPITFSNLSYVRSRYYISENGNSILISASSHTIIHYSAQTNEHTVLMTSLHRENPLFPFSISSNGKWGTFDNNGIQVVNLESFEIIRIASGYFPIISPDGEKIFFIQERDCEDI